MIMVIVLPNLLESYYVPCVRDGENMDTMNSLEHISKMCSQNASFIVFQNSILPRIPTKIFKIYPNLHTLQIRNCSLTDLQPSVFSDAKKLERLDISESNLPILKNGIFSGCSNMSVLFISYSGINRLESHAFAGLMNLQSLELFANNLTSLPDGVFDQLPKLSILRLSKNHLTVLNARTFRHSLKLSTVHFDRNGLEYMDPNIFDNSKVSWLDLSGNPSLGVYNLTERSEQYLELLDVANTSLKSIKIPKILHSLSADFNYMSSIELRDNTNTSKITLISIAHNNITHLSEFLKFPKLEVLDVQGNHISNMDYNVLSQLPNISTLSLIRNPITENINVIELCNALPRLHNLKLSRNHWTNFYVEELTDDLFSFGVELFMDYNSEQPITKIPPVIIELSTEKPTTPQTKQTTLPSTANPNPTYEEVLSILNEMRKKYGDLESNMSAVMKATITTSNRLSNIVKNNAKISGSVTKMQTFVWAIFSIILVWILGLCCWYFKIYLIVWTCCRSSVNFILKRRAQYSQAGLADIEEDVEEDVEL